MAEYSRFRKLRMHAELTVITLRCRYSQTLLPFCHWEAVVGVVETRRWGVVDISGFWPGGALQESSITFRPRHFSDSKDAKESINYIYLVHLFHILPFELNTLR